MTLPHCVEITKEHLQGDYWSRDCPLARALKSMKVPIGKGPGEYIVGCVGRVLCGNKDVAQYRYESGEQFCCDSLKAGFLVLGSGTGI